MEDNNDFSLPQSLAPELAEVLSKPEVLDAIKGIIAERTTGLANKNKELLENHSKFKKTVDELGGIDTIKTKLTATQEAERQAEEAKRQAALTGTDAEAKIKALQEMLAAKDTEINSFKEQSVMAQRRDQITNAFGDHVHNMKIAGPLIDQLVKHEVVDGKMVFKAFKEDGTPLLRQDGGDATLADLRSYMEKHPEYAPAFKASNKSGSGAKQQVSGPSVASNPFDKSGKAYNLTEAMALFRTNPGLARNLANAVGFKGLPSA